MLQTKQEIKMHYRGYDITIPKGTRVTHQTAMGYDENYNFIDDLSFIDRSKQYGLYHDAYYYGINIDKSLIEKV